LKRLLTLILGGVAGYVIGTAAVALPMIVLSMIGKAPGEGLHLPIQMAGALIGAVVALLRVRGAPRESSRVHGSARFSRDAEDKANLAGAGLIVGRAPRGWLMRYRGPAHLLTIAPTRSGKGVGAIIPNLLTANRSVICVDPKGENARIAARARRKFGLVHVLDPFEVTGQAAARFNPLANLAPYSRDLAEDAALIAEALVYDPPHQTSEAHWNEEAKALITGLVLHVVCSGDASIRNLSAVRELLTSSPEEFAALLQDMQDSGAAQGLVRRAANRHLGKSDREAAGVLSAAQRHTHFLDSPRISDVLERSDFAFSDLKAGVATVFLVLPPDRLATHARWLRLLVVQAITAIVRAPNASPTAIPTLMLLDEFAALGHLEAVERAFGLMAGYGLQIWAILQDLHQLKSTYGAHAGTFLSNAGLIQVFSVAEIDTASWVSRTLGATTEAFYTTAATTSRADNRLVSTRGSSTNLNLIRRDLMTPDEVMRLGADNLLLLMPGSAPAQARKVRYYVDPEFVGMFDTRDR
jgi:type IV secretion system protein VirD4